MGRAFVFHTDWRKHATVPDPSPVGAVVGQRDLETTGFHATIGRSSSGVFLDHLGNLGKDTLGSLPLLGEVRFTSSHQMRADTSTLSTYKKKAVPFFHIRVSARATATYYHMLIKCSISNILLKRRWLSA